MDQLTFAKAYMIVVGAVGAVIVLLIVVDFIFPPERKATKNDRK